MSTTSDVILMQLGTNLCSFFNRKVTSTNYSKVGTFDGYLDFVKQNWSLLQELHENLIDLNELDNVIQNGKFGKWDLYCLIIGETNSRFDRINN
jgi:hypothetical protein